MSKLVFVSSQSGSYLNHVVKESISEWGHEGDVREVKELGGVGGETLFGDSPLIVLDLGKDLVKGLVTHLSEIDEIEDEYPSGLIIKTDLALNQLKKVKEAVESLGGTTDLVGAKDKHNTADSLLGRLSLSKEARSFLKDYVGDKYQDLIPLVSSIEKLPAKSQRRISVESLYSRLPKPPGEVPPWNVEDYVFSGNVKRALEEAVRASGNYSKPLVVLSFLRRKIVLCHHIASLHSEAKYSKEEISQALGQKNDYGLTKALRLSKSKSVDEWRDLAYKINRYDAQLKGFSSVPVTIRFDEMIADITMEFRK